MSEQKKGTWKWVVASPAGSIVERRSEPVSPHPVLELKPALFATRGRARHDDPDTSRQAEIRSAARAHDWTLDSTPDGAA